MYISMIFITWGLKYGPNSETQTYALERRSNHKLCSSSSKEFSSCRGFGHVRLRGYAVADSHILWDLRMLQDSRGGVNENSRFTEL